MSHPHTMGGTAIIPLLQTRLLSQGLAVGNGSRGRIQTWQAAPEARPECVLRVLWVGVEGKRMGDEVRKAGGWEPGSGRSSLIPAGMLGKEGVC